MNVNHLFPTPVAFFKYPKKVSKKHLEFSLAQEMMPNMGNTTSKLRSVLEEKEYKDIASFAMKSLDEYMKQIISPKNNVTIRITQSWFNYSKPGQFHHKHAHPNSYLSGVFYVQADKGSDKIFFYKDGYQQIKLLVDNFNVFNSDSWWLPVETGDLVIFPSSLTHMVEPVTSEQTRISLAFNTFPVGSVGSNDDLTELKL